MLLPLVSLSLSLSLNFSVSLSTSTSHPPPPSAATPSRSSHSLRSALSVALSTSAASEGDGAGAGSARGRGSSSSPSCCCCCCCCGASPPASAPAPAAASSLPPSPLYRILQAAARAAAVTASSASAAARETTSFLAPGAAKKEAAVTAAALLLLTPFPAALPGLSPPALPTRALRSISAATASSALAETSASEASSSSRRRRSLSNVPGWRWWCGGGVKGKRGRRWLREENRSGAFFFSSSPLSRLNSSAFPAQKRKTSSISLLPSLISIWMTSSTSAVGGGALACAGAAMTRNRGESVFRFSRQSSLAGVVDFLKCSLFEFFWLAFFHYPFRVSSLFSLFLVES